MDSSLGAAPDTLLIGAGDLGTEIGLRLASGGHHVVAVRRRAERVPTPLTGISGDIRAGLPHLPEFAGPNGGPELLVICLTAGGRDEDAYRRVFLDGVRAVLRDLRMRGWAPTRALFVSSTGVCAPDGEITEATPPEPASPTARVLLAAEQQFLDLLPEATTGVIVRPSGLYGPGRTWFIDQVRDGRVSHPQRMTHRIHRDDAAAAIVHLLTMPSTPENLYLLTDDEPVRAQEVADFIADALHLTPPSGAVDAAGTDSPRAAPQPDAARHLSNARLHSTGFIFTYPSYREGYSAILDGSGTRHG